MLDTLSPVSGSTMKEHRGLHFICHGMSPRRVQKEFSYWKRGALITLAITLKSSFCGGRFRLYLVPGLEGVEIDEQLFFSRGGFGIRLTTCRQLVYNNKSIIYFQAGILSARTFPFEELLK
jgi:hypothetical protein